MTLELFIAILCIVLLGACSTLGPPPPPLAPSGNSLNIDRALLVECKSPALLKSGKEADVIKWGSDIKGKLQECSANHHGLINAIKSVK